MEKVMMDKPNWYIFLIEGDDFLNKYSATCSKVSAEMEKQFDGEPVCNKKILRTKTKSHGD